MSAVVWQGTGLLAYAQTPQLTISCPTGQLAMGAGYYITGSGTAFPLDLYPISDSSWAMYVLNDTNTTVVYTVTMYLTCETSS